MSILLQPPSIFLAIYSQLLADFSTELIYTDLLARCRNHLLVKLAERIDFGPLETACAAFHHAGGPGKPATYPIGCLVRAFLVGWLYGLSLRELEQRLYSDLLVRWFVGLGLFEPAPDHSTLERFTVWVREHQTGIFFDTIHQQILEAFPKEHQRSQIGDTYAMQANAADENLGRRIRHVCQSLLSEMVKAMPETLEQCLKGYEWVNLFGVKPEASDWKLDVEQRKQRLSGIALAADELHQRVERVLGSYSSRAYPQVRQWLGYLGKVLCDELHFDWDAAQPQASELPNKDKGSYRLIGAADPEATLRTHGKEAGDTSLGYNVQVAISTSGFIHETHAYTGACPDQSGIANLVGAQIERTGYCPPKLIYDKAGGAGKIRGEIAMVSQGHCFLSAHLPEYEKRSPCYGPYDFSLSEDGSRLTCPGGQTSQAVYPSNTGDGVVFRFLAFQCWNGRPPGRKKADREAAQARRCQLWDRCRGEQSGNQSHRQIFISDYRSLVLQAQVYNQSLAFKQDMKLRPRVERVIFELTHYNGARRCRRRGLANADFQARMCAVSYNLKLWMRRVSGRPSPRA